MWGCWGYWDYWKRKQGKLTVSNLKVKEQKIRNDEVIRIDQQGAPDSNSLTEVDREQDLVFSVKLQL